MKISRAMMYSALCLMLMTLAPISHSNAADLQTPPGGEFESIKNKSIDEPEEASFTSQDHLPDTIGTIDSVSPENQDDKAFEVPLPSTIWLITGGLFALVLIRRKPR